MSLVEHLQNDWALERQVRRVFRWAACVVAITGVLISIIAGVANADIGRSQWPATISELNGNFSQPHGRLFFAFTLTSGILAVRSNVYAFDVPYSFSYTCEYVVLTGIVLVCGCLSLVASCCRYDTTPLRQVLFVSGVLLVGTIPTASVLHASLNEWALILVHMVAAMCCFVIHPCWELVSCWKYRGLPTVMATRAGYSCRATAWAVAAMVFFALFVWMQFKLTVREQVSVAGRTDVLNMLSFAFECLSMFCSVAIVCTGSSASVQMMSLESTSAPLLQY